MSSCSANFSNDRIFPVRCGELVINGGMEAFTGTVPTGWSSTTPTLLAEVTAAGLVHSGSSAVTLQNGAVLTQTISNIGGCRSFEFSLFANAVGATPTVGFNASVFFITSIGNVFGGAINVPSGFVPASDVFSYYRIITSAAPLNTTAARIEITANTGGAGELLNLDDVSLSVQ